MAAEAERVLAVTGVGRASRRLDVGHPIGLRTEHPQKGLRVHGAGADLEVVRLLDDAAAVGPVLRQRENQRLEIHEPPVRLDREG